MENIHCIDLDQPQLEGFRSFISAWLIDDVNFTAVVDPGPLSTIPVLLNKLRQLGVNKIDYILLTHIHIDHAGGTGELLRHYPMAHIVCHSDGIRHMVAPEKLWQGSLQVLGKMAEVYGEIIAVPVDKISFMTHVGDTGIDVYQTPGHASHHLCYKYGKLLFGGEVCGVHSLVVNGVYMRPATPPKFMLDVAIDSIDKMIALKPDCLVIAHHGLVDDALKYLRLGKQQLHVWMRAVAATTAVVKENRSQAIYDWLLESDEVFRNITQLDSDIYQRERYFMENSLRGMIAYFDALSPEQQSDFV